MPTERVSNISAYEAVAFLFSAIEDQSLMFGVPLELDLNDFLPSAFVGDYTFGIKSGTHLPPNFALNTMTGIVMGTVMANFLEAYNPIFTARTQGVTVESSAVGFILENPALWTNSQGVPLWTNANNIPLWTK